MTRDTVTLDDLRQRVTDIDRQLIALVAERKAVSEEVARVKRATGTPDARLRARARRDPRRARHGAPSAASPRSWPSSCCAC